MEFMLKVSLSVEILNNRLVLLVYIKPNNYETYRTARYHETHHGNACHDNNISHFIILQNKVIEKQHYHRLTINNTNRSVD